MLYSSQLISFGYKENDQRRKRLFINGHAASRVSVKRLKQKCYTSFKPSKGRSQVSSIVGSKSTLARERTECVKGKAIQNGLNSCPESRPMPEALQVRCHASLRSCNDGCYEVSIAVSKSALAIKGTDSNMMNTVQNGFLNGHPASRQALVAL